MKTIELINGEWKTGTSPQLTEEQAAILQSRPLWNEQRRALLGQLSFYGPADPDDAAAAQAIYDQHKVADAEVVSVSISLPEGTGIINYRISGEHQQIRF
jgi:hypothetical protein